MRNKRYFLLLTVVLGFTLILFNCSTEISKFSINPKLPFSKNYSTGVDIDSSIFSIELVNNKLLIFDNKSDSLIEDDEGIESFLCKELKNNNIKNKSNYPISLFIDSTTSFLQIDKLIEELKLIGFQKVFFRTSNKGFVLYIPSNNSNIQSNAVKLYGERFKVRRNILTECINEIPKKSTPVNTEPFSPDSPPPPPPPPPIMTTVEFSIPDSLYQQLKNISTLDSSETGLISIVNDDFYLNNKKYTKENFVKTIYNKNTLFIKLSENNNYSDLIKIMDLIYDIQQSRYENYSILKYNKKYLDLNSNEAMKIRRGHSFAYAILSLAGQKYIDEI